MLYLLGVILFGAWVRITGSGAGCGSHWPTCHGVIIPIEPNMKTIIEFTHRLTSGLLGILALGFVVVFLRKWGLKAAGKAAIITLFFVIAEALVGAGIVLKELVTDDASVARATVIAFHLVNTLFLTGSAALAAHWVDREPSKYKFSKHLIFCAIAMVAIIATSLSGAITALGDTLFPIDIKTGHSIFSNVEAGLDATNHFLIRLRIIHPIIATITAIGVAIFCFWSIENKNASRYAKWGLGIAIVQLVAGYGNIFLGAPGYMQLTHLFLAQALWICVVLVTVEIAMPRK